MSLGFRVSQTLNPGQYGFWSPNLMQLCCAWGQGGFPETRSEESVSCMLLQCHLICFIQQHAFLGLHKQMACTLALQVKAAPHKQH